MSGYEGNYKNVVLTTLLRDVYQILWTLLFLVPGIVKSYSYRMVSYLLTDDPSMPPKEAITRSREMMKGQKWRAFVLDLSFIGWGLLSAITFGLVGIFYSNPYQYATEAELYRALRGEDAGEPAEETAVPELEG